MSLLEDLMGSVVASFGAPGAPAATVDGFGADLDCADDLRDDLRMAGPTLALAQAAYRRLTTPRGGVIDAPDYGFDLRSLLSRGMTPAELAAVPGLVRGELTKDERFEDVETRARKLDSATLELVIRCRTSVGPFELTMNVTAAAAAFAGVR
ncbi:hypothetical protein WME90_02000 [Sorangium sp. So ce375]|uniref:hypothetical protein n=1 Tax=Sorangium sp. So ce375 TaxID=3133306 RepID=UPI003F5C99F8